MAPVEAAAGSETGTEALWAAMALRMGGDGAGSRKTAKGGRWWCRWQARKAHGGHGWSQCKVKTDRAWEERQGGPMPGGKLSLGNLELSGQRQSSRARRPYRPSSVGRMSPLDLFFHPGWLERRTRVMEPSAARDGRSSRRQASHAAVLEHKHKIKQREEETKPPSERIGGPES